jgi:hypothetical protein
MVPHGILSMIDARFGFERPDARKTPQTAPFDAARPGRWAGLLAALRQRRQEQRLSAAMTRLEETSPHLLADIGLAATTKVIGPQDHAAHMAADLEIAPDPVAAMPRAPVVLLMSRPVPAPAMPLPDAGARPAPAVRHSA